MRFVPTRRSPLVVRLTGQHCSPGRFFAATELKLMMAHLVVNYDMQFEKDGPTAYPPNKWFGLSFTPDPTVKVMFRKRRN